MDIEKLEEKCSFRIQKTVQRKSSDRDSNTEKMTVIKWTEKEGDMVELFIDPIYGGFTNKAMTHSHLVQIWTLLDR